MLQPVRSSSQTPRRRGGVAAPCIPFLLNCWLYGKDGGSQLMASRRESLPGALALEQLPEQRAGGPAFPELYRDIGCSLPKTLIPHEVQNNCKGSRRQEGCIYPMLLCLHRKPKGRISVTGCKCCFTYADNSHAACNKLQIIPCGEIREGVLSWHCTEMQIEGCSALK